jgi:hypothetical protein
MTDAPAAVSLNQYANPLRPELSTLLTADQIVHILRYLRAHKLEEQVDVRHVVLFSPPGFLHCAIAKETGATVLFDTRDGYTRIVASKEHAASAVALLRSDCVRTERPDTILFGDVIDDLVEPLTELLKSKGEWHGKWPDPYDWWQMPPDARVTAPSDSDLPSNLRFDCLCKEDAVTVNAAWTFHNQWSLGLLEESIVNRASSCVRRRDSGELVAWVLTRADRSAGSAFVVPEFRRFGLATLMWRRVIVMLRDVRVSAPEVLEAAALDPLVGEMIAQGVTPHAYVARENIASAGIQRKLGAVAATTRAHWGNFVCK